MESEKSHYKLYLCNLNQSCQNNNTLLDRRFDMSNNKPCISFRPEFQKCGKSNFKNNKKKVIKEGFQNYQTENLTGFSKHIQYESELKNLSKIDSKKKNRGVENNSLKNNIANIKYPIKDDGKKYNKCIQTNIGFTNITEGKCDPTPQIFNNLTKRKCQKIQIDN